MRKEHNLLLSEITSEIELMSIVGGGGGTGQWETGAATVYAGVMGALGYSCSLPGGFYGPSNPTPTGGGTCVGGFSAGGFGPMGGNGGPGGSTSSASAAANSGS